jgi:hypothetical protein
MIRALRQRRSEHARDHVAKLKRENLGMKVLNGAFAVVAAIAGLAQVQSASTSFSQTTFMESIWVLLRNLVAGSIGQRLFISSRRYSSENQLKLPIVL